MYKWTSQYLLVGASFLLSVSGCGGGGGSNTPPGPPPTPTYSINGNISGMDNIRSIELSLDSEILLVSQDGGFSFNQRLEQGDEYEIDIEREPARQD